MQELAERLERAEQRVGQLEIQSRHYRRLVLGMFVCGCFCILLGAAAKMTEFDEIIAKRITIATDRQKILADLSGTDRGRLVLKSADGQRTAALIVTDSGAGLLLTVGGKQKVMLGINSDGDGYLDLHNAAGKGRTIKVE